MYLLKTTNEFRFETLAEVDNFEQEWRDMSANKGFSISSFTKTLKVSKDEEYYVVKVVSVFNVAKNPEMEAMVYYRFPDTLDSCSISEEE